MAVRKTAILLFAVLAVSRTAESSARSRSDFDPESAIADFQAQSRQFQETRETRQAKTNVLRVDTNLVLVDVIVKNAKGEVTTQPKKEDFKLYDNGAPQEISELVVDKIPLAVALVVDTSDSLQPTINKLRNASRVAFQSLKDADQVALITFNVTPNLDVPLTPVKDQILEKINGLVAKGGTDINSAIAKAMDHLHQAAPGPDYRRVIIVVSDNIAQLLNTGREPGHQDLVKLALQWDISIYNVQVPGEADAPGAHCEIHVEEGTNLSIPDTDFSRVPPSATNSTLTCREEWERVLKAGARDNKWVYVPSLVDSSGGERFDIGNLGRNELQEALSSIITSLRTRYTLTYYPSESSTPPQTQAAGKKKDLGWDDEGEDKGTEEFHKLKVDLTPQWVGYTIRHREGYYAFGKRR